MPPSRAFFGEETLTGVTRRDTAPLILRS